MYSNPVLRWDFADPHVIEASDGFYYAYSTEHLTYDRLAYVQVARSPDLVSWELLPDAMPGKPEWAQTTRDFWAPGVIEAEGRYYMYFSGIPDGGEGMCLGVATSDSPAGPFAPEDEPLRCGDGFTNIDPMPFDDPKTGKSLLYWGSDGSPIMVQELASDRTSFAPGTTPKDLIFPSGMEAYERLIQAITGSPLRRRFERHQAARVVPRGVHENVRRSEEWHRIVERVEESHRLRGFRTLS